MWLRTSVRDAKLPVASPDRGSLVLRDGAGLLAQTLRIRRTMVEM
jgi:hypothetical protein